MNPRDIALATLPPALWAITYVIAKPATSHFPPLFLIAVVYGLTALSMARPWRWRTPFVDPAGLRYLWGRLQSGLIYAGIARVPASLAILVVQSQVPFAVIAAWLLGQERLHLRRLIGIAVALAGVAIVVGVPAAASEMLGPYPDRARHGLLGRLARIDPRLFPRNRRRMIGAIALIACPQLLIASFILESGRGVAGQRRPGRVGDGCCARPCRLRAALFHLVWHVAALSRGSGHAIRPADADHGCDRGAVFLGEQLSVQSIIGGIVILLGLALVVGLPPRANAAA